MPGSYADYVRTLTGARDTSLTTRLLRVDLRRSAAKGLRRAGVSEGEIMKLCGWRTKSMFDRNNIIDEQDLARAEAKRLNSKQAANVPVVGETAEPLS